MAINMTRSRFIAQAFDEMTTTPSGALTEANCPTHELDLDREPSEISQCLHTDGIGHETMQMESDRFVEVTSLQTSCHQETDAASDE